jgi:outer membrane protein assembly factor BamB
MRRTGIFVGLLTAFLALPLALTRSRLSAAQIGEVGIYTYHGDNMRTGWNNHETALSHATVNTTQFGKLWSAGVDGQIYAQPLYAPGVDLRAGGTHNLIFIATEHNSVYAFDADTGGGPLWQARLGTSVPNSASGVPCNDIEGPEYGITGTPAIDPETGTLFVAAKTRQGSLQSYHLHALDITTGEDRVGWPVTVQGSVPGNAVGNSGGQVAFNPKIQHQRPGLLIMNGRVYIAFGAHCDNDLQQYHGWIFSYSVTDPGQPPQVFNTTPEKSVGAYPEAAGGIWQSGFGLAADNIGNLYFQTGNGLFNADLGGRNVGDSVVRLQTADGNLTFQPSPENFFTPSNERQLDKSDADLGSGGTMVIPDQPDSATPHLLAGCGKDGIIRLLNRDFLGGHTGRTNPKAADNAIQDLPGNGGTWCGPAYWEGPGGHYLFYTGDGGRLRRFRLGTRPDLGGKSWLTQTGMSSTMFAVGNAGFPSPTPVISSDGPTPGTGIVWLLRRDDDSLRAYDADTLALLWSSGTGDDTLGGRLVKFSVPVVAGGRVYAGMKADGSHGYLVCYGLK